MKCNICNKEQTIRTMAMHLKWNHKLKTQDYINLYGEFRPKFINKINQQLSSNKVCELCKQPLISHKNLIHHLSLHPEITWQSYFIKYIFNGIPPVCKCGCQTPTELIRHGKNDKGEESYARDYIKGHWDWIKPGYHHHTQETKDQMRISAIKRIENEKGLFKGESKNEKELLTFIKSHYTHDIISNDTQTLNGKELDILLPSLNLAFEYNGTYYHSDLFKDKNYHIKKSKECEKQNIQLIHIWDTDWIYKRDIVKSMILNKLKLSSTKIYARKCIIKEISSRESTLFLSKNHLQGGCISKINLGLYYNNELVSIMTFGKLRKNFKQNHTEGHWELVRFCNILNTNVVGAASKLFKYFTTQHSPQNIVSYANKDHSNGNLYRTLNMNLLTTTPPGYHWYKSKIRYNRFNFRKDVLVKQGADPNKTEYEIMLEQGYYRTWNTGNLKYEWLFNR
jgi:hypothetical protein